MQTGYVMVHVYIFFFLFADKNRNTALTRYLFFQDNNSKHNNQTLPYNNQCKSDVKSKGL